MWRPAVVRFGVVALALLLTGAPARAGGIVLESYTGERPADAARLLAPVLDELARRDIAGGEALARRYEAQVSRPAQQAPGLPPDFAAQIDRGFRAWVGGRFAEAIELLVPLIEAAHANPGALARDPALRDPLLQGLIALGLAYQRSGDASAMRATFAELVRSFPDARIPRATYGPDAQQAFEQTQRDIAATGKGTLHVVVAGGSGVVFIDEAYRAVGSLTAELVPGAYRVVVMVDKQPSRNHRVDVRAGAESVVEIDARLDRAVRTTRFAGLAFATPADREAHEARYAQQIARSLGATTVAVVGIDEVRGRRAVVGSVVSVGTGGVVRRAVIPVEPEPASDQLRALARYLAGDAPAPDLEVERSPRDDVTPPSTERSAERAPERRDTARWGGWRFLTAGLGIAALGAGIAQLVIDGRCTEVAPAGQQCADYYDTALGGYLSLGGGVALGALSFYLFATHDRGPVATVTSSGATLGFATRW